jgi:DNA-directed RNA polymerase subunit H (RpoH/RPB5)
MDYENEYNEESKIMIIIENVAKMLSKRRAFLHIPFATLHKQFLDNLKTDQTFFDNDEQRINLAITFEKLKKFDKYEEKDYINNSPNVYKILVAAKATARIISFFEKQQSSELIFVSDVLSDRSEHITNPLFILLSKEDQERVKQEFNMSDENFPVIKYGIDPMYHYYQFEYGEIIEINRASETAGIRVSYSICK